MIDICCLSCLRAHITCLWAIFFHQIVVGLKLQLLQFQKKKLSTKSVFRILLTVTVHIVFLAAQLVSLSEQAAAAAATVVVVDGQIPQVLAQS